MKILFTKMHGLGNDYIFIDRTKNRYLELSDEKLPQITRYMSKEHFGIGSDGIILIENSNIADFKMRIFNKMEQKQKCVETESVVLQNTYMIIKRQ